MTDTKSIDQKIKRGKEIRAVFSYITVIGLLLLLFFLSVNIGSIKLGLSRLLNGLFVAYDEEVAIVYDLRFPRIFISILAGAAIAVAGVIFQAALKNPLADPGIIGISAGAGFFSILVTAMLPGLYLLSPIFACLGGILAFFLVYLLSWKGGLTPIRVILVGVAIGTMFSSLSSAFNFGMGSALSGVASIVNGNITMKTWDDVMMLFLYIAVGLVLSLACAPSCNLMFLEDKTIRSLGVNVTKRRLMISILACILASCSTAVVGAIGFLGLIVPHIGRLLVGNEHKKLLPFSMLLGAFVFLLADTLGRTVAYPYEIPAAIIMSVVGGPFFVILLRRSKTYGQN